MTYPTTPTVESRNIKLNFPNSLWSLAKCSRSGRWGQSPAMCRRREMPSSVMPGPTIAHWDGAPMEKDELASGSSCGPLLLTHIHTLSHSHLHKHTHSVWGLCVLQWLPGKRIQLNCRRVLNVKMSVTLTWHVEVFCWTIPLLKVVLDIQDFLG